MLSLLLCVFGLMRDAASLVYLYACLYVCLVNGAVAPVTCSPSLEKKKLRFFQLFNPIDRIYSF
jgi:hypothetical protein